MEITLLYAIALGSCLGIAVLRKRVYDCIKIICPIILNTSDFTPVAYITTYVHAMVQRYLSFPTVLRRGRYVNRWSLLESIVLMSFLSINASCVIIHYPGIAEAGLRAGMLSIINAILLFAGPHLSFVADLLGISIRAFRRLHVSAGIVSIIFALFHSVVGATTRQRFSLRRPSDLWALIAVLSYCVQLIPFALRPVSYEFSLRVHQMLSLLFAYALYRHVPLAKLFPRIYIYVGAGIFLATIILQIVIVCYRNNLDMSPARISYDRNTIKVRLHLNRPIKVDAGQYISVWIPSAGFWSMTQTHPFTIVSWSPRPQQSVDLFIEPRRGLTRNLDKLSEYGATTSLVLFSGPHGQALNTDQYENILMIATGFGIAAHLPFLSKLISTHHARTLPLRRIHLVWQFNDREIGIAAQELLNKALEEDRSDGDYILQISMYLESRNTDRCTFGTRATLYPGMVPLEELLDKEVTARRPRSRTAILVSIAGKFEENLIASLRSRADKNLDLLHTEYQP